MPQRRIGIIVNGVTGRMGTNQHLIRSIMAIIKQGGVKVSDDLSIMPVPILTGRNENKLKALSERCGGLPYTTDVDAALRDPANEIFFDSSGTLQRGQFVEKAVAAKKAIYCEKPTAVNTAEALRLATLCEKAGLKNGVVQDKLWLPGMRKLALLKQQGFFGQILSVRGEFGYWVFPGTSADQPAQRPSWNYRSEDGGSIIIDMFCHWRYVIDNLFGDIASLSCIGATHIPTRVDEQGKPYKCTADDAAYGTFELDNGIICQFNSSWTTRVRRDDLLTLHVDGTKGSAVAGLRQCWIQPESATPKPVWNPDIPNPINFTQSWTEMPDACEYDNAFKIQWELFLKHVVTGSPFPWTMREGAKGVQLAELGLQSWKSRSWVKVPKVSSERAATT
jgi:predicted dehydrogenase